MNNVGATVPLVRERSWRRSTSGALAPTLRLADQNGPAVHIKNLTRDKAGILGA